MGARTGAGTVTDFSITSAIGRVSYCNNGDGCGVCLKFLKYASRNGLSVTAGAGVLSLQHLCLHACLSRHVC